MEFQPLEDMQTSYSLLLSVNAWWTRGCVEDDWHYRLRNSESLNEYIVKKYTAFRKVIFLDSIK